MRPHVLPAVVGEVAGWRQPERVAGPDARGGEIGLEKLILFPDKLAHLRAPALDDSYPICLELSLTHRCDNACVWCSDADLRRRERGELALGTVRRLLGDVAAGGTRGVVIEGGGEPTLHPAFDEVVQEVRAHGLAAGLITNGTRPLAPATLARLQWVRVSLDATGPESYRRLKGSDRFALVLENLAAYRAHAPVVGVGYVVTRTNLRDIGPLLARLDRIGIDYVHFRPVVDMPRLAPRGDLSRLARRAYAHLHLLAAPMRENRLRGNGGLPCRAHSLTSVVTASGNVLLCGRLHAGGRSHPIGNINLQPFADIWRGRRRRTLAARVLDGAWCRRHCPECRLSKYNALLARLDGIATRDFI